MQSLHTSYINHHHRRASGPPSAHPVPGAGLSRVMCARRALVPQKSRIDFDSFSTYLKVSRHAGRVR
jgi:hypothetical protein